MASQGGSSSSVNIPEIREENENKPLWKYVTTLDKTVRGEEIGSFSINFVILFSKAHTQGSRQT